MILVIIGLKTTAAILVEVVTLGRRFKLAVPSWFTLSGVVLVKLLQGKLLNLEKGSSMENIFNPFQHIDAIWNNV